MCRRLERPWRRSRLTSDYQFYTDQSTVVRNTIFKSKMDYYSSLIYSAESDSKTLFRTITRLLHSRADKLFPTSSSAVDLVNKFVHFFGRKSSISEVILVHLKFLISSELRLQFALIEGCRSQTRELKCGVPQGFLLRPILYVLYTAPLADVLRFHEMQFHFYAGATQLCISFSAKNDMELTNSITKIEECLSNIDKWMSINRLN